MKYLFKNAYFGKQYKTRNSGIAIYLSTEYRGHENDKYNPPFILVHMVLERHIHYTDGSENKFHEIVMYDGEGHSNRFDPDHEYDDDIIFE